MRLRPPAVLALGSLLVAGAVALPASPALADETYPIPASGVLQLQGHGWGHGRGLSQWGAEGAAKQGVSATKILDFYYPGTTATQQGNPTIRVALTELGAEGYQPGQTSNPDRRYQCDAASTTPSVKCDLEVLPAAGLTVTDLATGTSVALSDPAADRYGINADPGGKGLTAYMHKNGAWTTVPIGGKTVLTGPLRFAATGDLSMSYRDGTVRSYHGTLEVDSTGATTFMRVNALPIENYLQDVVPRESPAWWPAAALQAQAVAARSYSTYEHVNNGGSPWDICDSTFCQVYGGASVTPAGGTTTQLESQSTNDAIAATAGIVRTYNGQVIFAQFSSSNGGWTVAGSQPYLIAEQDPWDAIDSPYHDWTATLSAAQLQAKFPQVGTVQRMVIVSRDGNGDWGGRVTSVRLEGVDAQGQPTSVTTTGDGIRAANPGGSNPIRSSWFTVVAPAPAAAPDYTSKACPPSSTPNAGFTDTSGDAFAAAINCIAAYGVTQGRTATQYAPGETVLRREMAMFLSNLLAATSKGRPPGQAPCQFVDISTLPQDEQNAICAIAAAGISQGKQDAQHFDPGAPVLRGEMASFLRRTLAFAGYQVPASSNDYFQDDGPPFDADINALAAVGVVQGQTQPNGPRTYQPDTSLPRDEMAVFLARTLELAIEQGVATSRFASS